MAAPRRVSARSWSERWARGCAAPPRRTRAPLLRRCRTCRATGARPGWGRGSQPPSWLGFGLWVLVFGFGASRTSGLTGQREREVPRDEKTRIFAFFVRGKKRGTRRFSHALRNVAFSPLPENAQENSTQKISRSRDRETWSPFFVLFRGKRRGRGGSRTFPTVVGGRLGKSRRWSSWTWSWPWPASRGRSGGFSARPRRGRGSEKARGESPFRGSGLRPVTLARTKSFRKNARRKPSEARVPSEKNARRADG